MFVIVYFVPHSVIAVCGLLLDDDQEQIISPIFILTFSLGQSRKFQWQSSLRSVLTSCLPCLATVDIFDVEFKIAWKACALTNKLCCLFYRLWHPLPANQWRKALLSVMYHRYSNVYRIKLVLLGQLLFTWERFNKRFTGSKRFYCWTEVNCSIWFVQYMY